MNKCETANCNFNINFVLRWKFLKLITNNGSLILFWSARCHYQKNAAVGVNSSCTYKIAMVGLHNRGKILKLLSAWWHMIPLHPIFNQTFNNFACCSCFPRNIAALFFKYGQGERQIFFLILFDYLTILIFKSSITCLKQNSVLNFCLEKLLVLCWTLFSN